MKPNFALTLSFDGIGLLHRSPSGWLSVWDVGLNDPDLAGALQIMLGKAKDLDPSGVTSKVVIPNQQIRYLTFESESQDIDILEAQVRTTLNGATPYDVAELAYDWSMTGGEVCVAAVAIETLTEAESFAVDHGFGPLSFVAIPQDGAFQGEPFFGETVHAGEVLAPGQSVERDEEAIVVSGKALLTALDADPEPDASATGSDIALAPEETTITSMVGFQSARTGRSVESEPSDRNDQEPAPDIPAAVESAPEEHPAPMVAFSSARRSPSPDATSSSAMPEGRFQPGHAETPKEEPPVNELVDALEASEPETPEPEDFERDSLAPDMSTTADSAEPADDTPLDVPESETPILAERIPPAPDMPEELAAVAAAQADTFDQPVTPIRPSEKPAPPASKHPGRLPFLSRRKSDTAPRISAKPAAARKWNIPVRAGLSKARSVAAGLRRQKEPKPAAQRSVAPSRADERDRLTVFGARNPENTTTDTNPRFMALAVTAGLLLLLVGIAAWAALTLEGGLSSLFRSSEDVQFAEDPAAIEEPAVLSTQEDAQIAALPQDPPRDTEDLADEPLFTLNPDQAISEELSPDEVRTRYAATGIWQMSPQQSRAPIELLFEDVYQTSLDPDLNFSDAVALPNVASLLPGTRPATPADPLRPGEDGLERDERGLVVATPEGTVMLDGLTIFSGPPPLVPPATPDRPEPQPEPDVAEADTLPETAVEPETIETAEPTEEFAGLRPRPRPSTLIDAFERSNNGGRTLDELQNIRPRLRPQSAQEEAEEEALAEAGISSEDQADAETVLDNATDEAVAISIKPPQRPENFANHEKETREAAASEHVSIEQRVAVAIPSTASVARAATERNQIALRRVNLIGVYGSDASRRALVRLPNGRYRKVQVGDKLDGGQVAAIGSDELRYIKRGQSVVLKMPSG